MTYRQSQWFGAAGFFILAALLVAVVAHRERQARISNVDVRSAEAKEATRLRTEVQKIISSGKHGLAEQRLLELVDSYSRSSDKDTQDQVAAAEMTLGYLAANKQDYKTARERFTDLDKGYAGTGAAHPEFGRIDDQAAYQAIVCLQAEGKTRQAVLEYTEFLKARQDSPLVYAVHKRLKGLQPESAEEYEALLQAAIDHRDHYIKSQMAMCGPRALVYLLKVNGDGGHSVEDIAKLCKTTDDGTTLSDMAAALDSLGYSAKGLRLNREDFKDASAPLVWLMKTHYVVVLGWEKGKVRYYDPMYSSVRAVSVTKEQESEFSAVVLTVSPQVKEKSK